MRCAVTVARVAVDVVKPMHADAMPQAIVRRGAPTIANDVLRWAEFDLDRAVWHLPGERTKTGADLDIPLPVAAVTCLRELHRLATESIWE